MTTVAPLPERNELTLFARRVRFSIGVIASGLGFFFAWLQFKDVEFQYVVNALSPDFIWKLALVLYYFGWVFGTKFDTDIQEMAFVSLCTKRQWPIQSLGVLVLLAGVAAALCWTERQYRAFR